MAGAIYRKHRTPTSFARLGTKRLISLTDRDLKDGQHLALRHFSGNFSEMIRVLIRREMEREVQRTGK